MLRRLTHVQYHVQVAALPEDAEAPLRVAGDVDGAQWKVVSQCRHMPGDETSPGPHPCTNQAADPTCCMLCRPDQELGEGCRGGSKTVYRCIAVADRAVEGLCKLRHCSLQPVFQPAAYHAPSTTNWTVRQPCHHLSFGRHAALSLSRSTSLNSTAAGTSHQQVPAVM